MTPMQVDQAMQTALGHHQAGRLAEAEAIYRQVLAQFPDHADALHLLGVLACQAGRPDAAIELIGRAIAINPAVPSITAISASPTADRGNGTRRSPACAARSS